MLIFLLNSSFEDMGIFHLSGIKFFFMPGATFVLKNSGGDKTNLGGEKIRGKIYFLPVFTFLEINFE